MLSGGDINLLLLSKIIYKSLEHESRLIRIGFKIPDRPGTLYRIASAISEAGGDGSGVVRMTELAIRSDMEDRSFPVDL